LKVMQLFLSVLDTRPASAAIRTFLYVGVTAWHCA